MLIGNGDESLLLIRDEQELVSKNRDESLPSPIGSRCPHRPCVGESLRTGGELPPMLRNTKEPHVAHVSGQKQKGY